MDDQQRNRRLGRMALAGTFLAVAALAAPSATLARGGSPAVIHTGSCSAATDWKLKLKKDDGRIEVEFEVDQNRNNRTWNVQLQQDGTTFWSGRAVTRAPSGSFEVRRLATDRAGVHTFTGRATNPATHEVCVGSARI
jgi:hypothetical protein